MNSDPSKQAQQIIFSQKLVEPCHPLIKFNNLPIQNISFWKHLKLILDDKLNFDIHSKEKHAKFNKGVGFSKEVKNLPIQAFLTIWK